MGANGDKKDGMAACLLLTRLCSAGISLYPLEFQVKLLPNRVTTKSTLPFTGNQFPSLI